MPHAPGLRSVIALLALLPALAFPSSASAAPHVKFGHLSRADGLPETGVFTMLQDRLGFLWIGTQNGLVRYDGHDFTTFKPDPQDPGSLGGRIVLSLFEDSRGDLWVGTRRGGLDRFDRENQRFTHFRHRQDDPTSLTFDAVSAIVEDGDGNLWVGTGDAESTTGGGGLNRFDRASGSFTRFVHDASDPASLASDAITKLFADSRGYLWIATGDAGLDRLDRTSGTFTHYRHDADDPASLPHDFVWALTEDGNGRLWVGTNGGLGRLDAATGRFDRFRHDPAARGSLASDFISALYTDRDGAVWIGTWAGVLHRFNPELQSFLRYQHDPDDAGSLSANSGITTIVQDRTEILWIGTWRGGLNKLDRYAGKFPHFKHDGHDANSLSADRITDLSEDRAGNLWIGTHGGGLNRYNPRSDTFTHFRHDTDADDSLSSDDIRAVHQDRLGNLWIGTDGGGLDRFNPDGGTFTRYRHRADDPASLSDDRVISILEDSLGNLWIGTVSGGLNRLDRASGRFTRYLHLADQPGTLSHDLVRVIYEDRQGTLWTATENGLNRFEPESETFTSFLDTASGLDIILSIHEDRAGRFWIGTFNGGLHLFDRASGTSRAFTERQGLAHDTVFSILEDDQGLLWLSTGNGLSRFDPDSESFRGYGVIDGLQSHEFNGGAIKTRAGELLFGGENGINAFFPTEVKDDPHAPEVVLTALKLFNQPVEARSGGALERHISVADRATFTHRDNSISFTFSALHFGHPAGNRFAYRLAPLESSWNEVGGRRHASYTNLPPGNYRFQVKAANHDGVWNAQGASMQLTIQSPWWRTWWAYGLYALVLLGLIATADRLQRRRLLSRERQMARQREASLRTEAAELHAKAAEAQARLLQTENERKTLELESARALQLSMLPRELPQHPQLEIAAYMKTATEVGGDYYDFDIGDDGTLTVVIGDATGHGSAAGTMVTATKVLFNTLAGEVDSELVLRKSSAAIKQLNLDNMFMALALARIRDGRLELAGAGMPPALILRVASGEVEELGMHGAPLGSFADFPYKTVRAALAPGDTLVLMSDGLPEMLDGKGDLFGYDRLAETLREASALAPNEIVDHLSAAARGWAGGRAQEDDMTLVVLQMKVRPVGRSADSLDTANIGAGS